MRTARPTAAWQSPVRHFGEGSLAVLEAGFPCRLDDGRELFVPWNPGDGRDFVVLHSSCGAVNTLPGERGHSIDIFPAGSSAVQAATGVDNRHGGAEVMFRFRLKLGGIKGVTIPRKR